MGVLDRFLDAIKLNDDYDDEYIDNESFDEDEDDFLDDEEYDEKPKKKFFEKFSKKKSDDDFDDFEDDPIEKPKAAPKNSAKSAPKASAGTASRTSVAADRTSRPAQASSKITPIRGRRANSGQASNIEVCVIKPSSMEDTREIADTLLDNSTVILNLEGIDVELAQRIIDFASGACYSLNGTLQKIASYIFVLGPSNVDITGDLQNILGGAAPSVRAGY